VLGADEPSSVARGSAPETTTGASIARPSASTTPRAAPFATSTPRDRAREPDLGARLARGAAIASESRPMPPST
jgi:hypothetical protein